LDGFLECKYPIGLRLVIGLGLTEKRSLLIDFPVVRVPLQKELVQVINPMVPVVIDGRVDFRPLYTSNILDQFPMERKWISQKQRADMLNIRTLSKVLTRGNEYLEISGGQCLPFRFFAAVRIVPA